MSTSLFTFGQASHVGLKRSENQDSYGKFPREAGTSFPPRGHLFVVADGMGGHRGGREASQIAIHTLEEVYYQHPDASPVVRLRQAFSKANDVILQRAQADPELAGMGTTCTALLLLEREACIAHVGDSRAYRVGPEALVQLTHDHTRVQELVDQKILTHAEAAVHPRRNVLSRAMGVRPDLEVDVFEALPLQPGETYLLCSDGLDYVPEALIHQTVLQHDPQTACDHLVQLANDQGGHDNVTVQILRIHDLPAASDSATRTMKWFNWRGVVIVGALLALLAHLTG